jgi:hypothetical protein
VAAFPDNATQYSAMVAPTMVLGGTPLLTAAPQIVADVRYTYTPVFPIFSFLKNNMFYASASVAAPVGGMDQTTEINTNAPTNGVANCAY